MTFFDEAQIHRYKPTSRRLRVYAVDPKTVSLDHVRANELTLKVPWEQVTPGPVGEYVEVIDFDPESDCFYAPVDLNSPVVLAQDGIPPAEGDPRFHQQTVYAVVMTTLSHFEEGLGRPILWSPRLTEKDDAPPHDEFVQRLRVYPHALRGPNAAYSPSTKSLLMGYFSVSVESAIGSPVRADSFTCLSHSIIAHETTHAVLDGLRRVVTPSEGGAEEVAVQEAIADVIGLLQQIALPGFLLSQLTFTSDLDRNERLLEQLAKRLAQPVGLQAQLRRRIGEPSDVKQSAEPRIVKLEDIAAVLVAALFDVFLIISRKRIARLLDLAGIGANEHRELNRDLLEAISTNVAKSASHLLRMCIRAIDYCPPVDVTCGDYLRAMITADSDLAGEDDKGYRVALVNAFRRYGIYPLGAGTMSPADLLWQPSAIENLFTEAVRMEEVAPSTERQTEFDRESKRRELLHSKWRIDDGPTAEAIREMGLAFDKDAPHTIDRTGDGLPVVNIDSFRMARRTGLRGQWISDWVITVSQRRRGYFDPEMQTAQDQGEKPEPPDFILRGGCTLIVDAETLTPRYCISKNILSAARLARRRDSLLNRSPASTAVGQEEKNKPEEPFFALRGGVASVPQ